jgi:hypothetical protein
VVKRAASDCLTKYGIHKADPEFKEIWGFIYRGTEFALVCLIQHLQRQSFLSLPQRTQMQSRAIDSRSADKFVKLHAEMYVKGTVLPAGGSNGLQEGRSRSSSSTNIIHEKERVVDL